MAKATGKLQHLKSKGVPGVGMASSRRSYSPHSKKISNAFLVVFDQYEKAFEELSKV